MRSYDHSKLNEQLGFHDYIKTAEWKLKETRYFYYNGYEVVDKTDRSGRAYKAVRVFLLDEITKAELVLEINGFAYARSFKAASPVQYDFVAVTKIEEDYTKADGTPATTIGWEVKVDAKKRMAMPERKSEDINIEDIPF